MTSRHRLELGVEVLLELGHVEALELDLGRHAQEVELLQHPGRALAGQEPSGRKVMIPISWPPSETVDVVEAGRVAGREEPDPEARRGSRQTPCTATAPTASSTRSFFSIQLPAQTATQRAASIESR